MTKSKQLIQWMNERKQYFIIGIIIIGVVLYYIFNKEDDGLLEGNLMEIEAKDIIIRNSYKSQMKRKVFKNHRS